MKQPQKIERAYSLITVKAVDEEKREITGIATTPAPDRHGDVVEPKGAEFNLPLPLLWQHDSRQPVGKVVSAKVTKEGIEVRAQIAKVDAPAGLAARLEEAWQSVKAGLVSGLSIGFRALEYSFLDDTDGIRFTRWAWLELSLVTIPANAEASIQSIKSIDSQLRAASGNKRGGVVRLDATPAGVPALATKRNALEGNMNIAEQIKSFEATRAAKAARMAEIMKDAGDAGATLDDAQTEEYDGLADEVKAIDKHLKRLQEMEAINKSAAKPVDGTSVKGASESRAGVTVKNTQKLDKGIRFARYAMCLAAAKGDISIARSIAENRFGDDAPLNEVMKAAVAAGTTTDPAWAGNLVAHNDLTTDFIEYLRPRTIIGRFGQGGIPALRPAPFNVHIKGQNAGASAGWVGEGYAKPVTKAGYTDVYLGWAKVAGISVITEELARFSTPGAEGLVRDELARAVIERIDTDFVDPAKAAATGAAASPASITNGVTPIPSSGTDADAVRADIAALWAQADGTNLPIDGAVYITDSRTARQLGLLRNPLGQREFPDVTMLGGTIDGVPVIVSNYVPADSGGSLFILAFAPEILLADDGIVTLTASREASILMDTAPGMNSGTPTPAQLVSMFQTNSIALRAERYINWAKRRAQAVAYLDGVNWGVTP